MGNDPLPPEFHTVTALEFALAVVFAAPVVLVLGIAVRAWFNVPKWVGGRWRCRNCGYSLRGNVSGVCPECGTPAGVIPPPRRGTDDGSVSRRRR